MLSATAQGQAVKGANFSICANPGHCMLTSMNPQASAITPQAEGLGTRRLAQNRPGAARLTRISPA